MSAVPEMSLESRDDTERPNLSRFGRSFADDPIGSAWVE
jgi:hypothetical protein